MDPGSTWRDEKPDELGDLIGPTWATHRDAAERPHQARARHLLIASMLGSKTLDLPFVRTFSDVPLKEPLLYLDSRGRLGIAVNQGSFAAIYGIQPPQPIFIPSPGK